MEIQNSRTENNAKSGGPNTVPSHPQQARSGGHGQGQIKYCIPWAGISQGVLEQLCSVLHTECMLSLEVNS